MSGQFNMPRNVAILGGNSDIAKAIEAELLKARPGVRTIRCVRTPKDGEISYDATNPKGAETALVEAEQKLGELDGVIIAFGMLGSEQEALKDPEGAFEMGITNYTGAVSAGVASGKMLTKNGGGWVVYLSSFAGVRVRPVMPLYGSSKQGADAFFKAARARWREDGVKCLIVRPGYVHTKMVKDVKPVFGDIQPNKVANSIVRAMEEGRDGVIYAPKILKPLSIVARFVPSRVWDGLKK